MAKKSRGLPLLTLLTTFVLLVLPAIPAGAMSAPPRNILPLASPEGIVLEFVRGAANPGYILVDWQVTQETQTLGYELWRGTGSNPNLATRLNPPGFIPAQSPGGGSSYYSWQDSYNLVPGTTYYYWLKSLSDTGTWTTHSEPQFVPIVPYCSRYDINCSLAIDATDISEVASSWNCDALDPCYVERRDLNNDYIIDIRDIMPVAARWLCQFANTCYW